MVGLQAVQVQVVKGFVNENYSQPIVATSPDILSFEADYKALSSREEGPMPYIGLTAYGSKVDRLWIAILKIGYG